MNGLEILHGRCFQGTDRQTCRDKLGRNTLHGPAELDFPAVVAAESVLRHITAGLSGLYLTFIQLPNA